MRWGEEEIEQVEHYADAGDSGAVQVIHTWQTWDRPKPWVKRSGQHIGRATNRPPESVHGLCIHQTDVRGGFGARDLDHLIERYAQTPYHVIANPRYRIVLVQYPVAAYTYHGNGCNRYTLGVAIDGSYRDDSRGRDVLDAAAADVMREAIRTAIDIGTSEGAWPGRRPVIEAHAQHSAARAVDPGRDVWQRCVMPTIYDRAADLRPDHHTGTGRTLTRSWYEQD